jgi:hypothetical protein
MPNTVMMAMKVCMYATCVSAESPWSLCERAMYIPYNSSSANVLQKDATTSWHIVATFGSAGACRQRMEAQIQRHQASLDQRGQPTSRSTAASGIESIVSEIPDLKDQHITQYHCTTGQP